MAETPITTSARRSWADAPVLSVVRAHCVHCGSEDLYVTKSENNGDGSVTRKAVCKECSGLTKICVEMPESGNFSSELS